MAPKQLAILSGALVVAGCVLAAIATAPALDAVGIVIAGVGFVGLVSSAFYAVGQSEDREREREQRDRPPGRGA